MDVKVEEVCAVITEALLATSTHAALSAPVTAASEMGSPKEWDSLAFVAVFLAVSTHFGIDVEDDDAIRFTSVGKIVEFLGEFD